MNKNFNDLIVTPEHTDRQTDTDVQTDRQVLLAILAQIDRQTVIYWLRS